MVNNIRILKVKFEQQKFVDNKIILKRKIIKIDTPEVQQ